MTTPAKTGRNAPCPCGSGKKYKNCCEKVQPSSAEMRAGAEIESQFRNAGNLYRAGHNARAGEICGQILTSCPRHTGALCLLGRILLNSGDSSKATELFKTALEVSPRDIQALYFCGRALGEAGRFMEAVPYLQKATQVDPGFAEGYNFLGTMMHVMGRTDEAAALALKAVQIDRNNPQLHSHQLVCAHSNSRYSAAEQFGFHKEWAARHASRFYTKGAYINTPDPERKIRVGYVSPRFNRDIVGYFFKSVFDQHSREDLEIFCYSNTRVRDDFTDYFACGAQWRDITNLSDEDAAKRIRDDEIDILVDISGHTPNNRLLVFARKPAPVQVTWLDYFDTTGLETMDYLITDPVSTPQSGTQQFVEQLIRMPYTRFCWSPPEFAPDVSEAPALNRGFVTFGSFNRPEKMTADVLRLWARILREIPDSRLLLKNRNFNVEDIRSHFLAAFSSEGIAAERIEMRGESPHAALLQEYADVDIALDTFPYNGGATTCDALLMGVPVLTLLGDRMISRQSASILSSTCLADFIAEDEENYVRVAVEWSRMVSLLAEMRGQINQRFVASPVCDARKFTADLERIYREIWGKWCAERNAVASA